MTIDMTLWRRAAACLVAGIGVVLALALAAADAQPRPLNQKATGYARCPEQYVCLFQDKNGQGRIIWYRKYGTYRLNAKSMVGKNGVSSYYNHQTGGARATLIGVDVPSLRLRNGIKQNVPREWNDRFTKVRLLP
jgi:hypothetical protein